MINYNKFKSKTVVNEMKDFWKGKKEEIKEIEEEQEDSLNPHFIRKQGTNEKTVTKIEKKHVERIMIFQLMEATENARKLKLMAKEIDRIDYEFQELWGFKKNSKYHTWWYRVPKCACPKIDNGDPMFFGRRIISGECIIHGTKK